VSLSLFSHLQRGFPPTTDISPPPPSTLLHFAFWCVRFLLRFFLPSRNRQADCVCFAIVSQTLDFNSFFLLLGAAHLKPLIG
jgi:hypothetical protein